MFEANTLLDIANTALIGIGERPIDALEDKQDKLSMQATMLLRQAILDVQGVPSKPWKELYEVKKLVLAEEEPKLGEWYFNKPTDLLCAVEMLSDYSEVRFEFREEGRYLIVPANVINGKKGVWLKYVRSSFDPGEWSSELRGCVIALFSARMMGVVSSDGMKALNLEHAFWKGEFVRRTENRILTTEAVEQYPRGCYPGAC